jgi:hypothetical protein
MLREDVRSFRKVETNESFVLQLAELLMPFFQSLYNLADGRPPNL